MKNNTNTAHQSQVHPTAVILDAIYVGHHAADHPQAPNQPVLAWVLQTSPRSKCYAVCINGSTVNFKVGTTEAQARSEAAQMVAANPARWL